MRIKGHGLQREGRAHDHNGNYIGGQTGYGLCECGAMTDNYVGTVAARRRWHVEHKQQAAGEDR